VKSVIVDQIRETVAHYLLDTGHVDLIRITTVEMTEHSVTTTRRYEGHCQTCGLVLAETPAAHAVLPHPADRKKATR
jgi:hypothetical protein